MSNKQEMEKMFRSVVPAISNPDVLVVFHESKIVICANRRVPLRTEFIFDGQGKLVDVVLFEPLPEYLVPEEKFEFIDDDTALL